MNKIEIYTHEGEGYNPYLITEKWQVAQLNYIPEIDFQSIIRVERHMQTDEVFILITGEALLISAQVSIDTIHFHLIKMVIGVTYNVPKGVWHSIAMGKSAQVIIVEDSNTHLHDVEYKDLTSDQRDDLMLKIHAELST